MMVELFFFFVEVLVSITCSGLSLLHGQQYSWAIPQWDIGDSGSDRGFITLGEV